jgi:uncharacterized repeat protein (TIGR04052 family)
MTASFEAGVAAGVLALSISMSCVAADAPSRAVSPVELHFLARVGDEPASCARTYQDVGRSKAAMFLQDFRIYISAVRLIAKDGSEVPVVLTADDVWQNEQVALLDFENGSGNCNGNAPTNDHIKGTVPTGEYRGVIFEIGVPFAMNHQDPTLAAAPLNYSALTWPWSIGYKFTTIDFDTKPASERTMQSMAGAHETSSASGFSVHLGSMNCATNGPRVPPQAPCGSPNRPSYRFDTFDPKRDVLVLDLAALLAGTDVTVNMPKSPSGCMAGSKDDDCVDIMDRFGLTFRGKPSAGQKFVRIERSS